jgi:hypothetical protein
VTQVVGPPTNARPVGLRDLGVDVDGLVKRDLQLAITATFGLVFLVVAVRGSNRTV